MDAHLRRPADPGRGVVRIPINLYGLSFLMVVFTINLRGIVIDIPVVRTHRARDGAERSGHGRRTRSGTVHGLRDTDSRGIKLKRLPIHFIF